MATAFEITTALFILNTASYVPVAVPLLITLATILTESPTVTFAGLTAKPLTTNADCCADCAGAEFWPAFFAGVATALHAASEASNTTSNTIAAVVASKVLLLANLSQEIIFFTIDSLLFVGNSFHNLAILKENDFSGMPGHPLIVGDHDNGMPFVIYLVK